jgi:hypothetical protein
MWICLHANRSTPITRLRYFAARFAELKPDLSSSYWAHSNVGSETQNGNGLASRSSPKTSTE